MALQTMDGTVPLTPFAGLGLRVIDYASRIEELRTPSDVLNELHDITTKFLPLAVLRRLGFPSRPQVGIPFSSPFSSTRVPKGSGGRISNTGARQVPPPFLAQSRMGPFTWAEAKQMVEPTD
jgi:hypothetical protein